MGAPLMAKWADRQPHDGETILHCPHVLLGGKAEFFGWAAPVRFSRPDGTWGESRWLVQCPACMVEMPTRGPNISGDSVWKGNRPAIKDVRG